jgi:hypothetical protein
MLVLSTFLKRGYFYPPRIIFSTASSSRIIAVTKEAKTIIVMHPQNAIEAEVSAQRKCRNKAVKKLINSLCL